MAESRINRKLYRIVASETGISEREIERAVGSFFSAIDLKARKLNLDNARRIYTKEKFEELTGNGGCVCNIPYIGRIGPVYSRYLKWRSNEAKNIVQVPRSNYRSRMLQSEVENMAEEIMSGRTPSPVSKKKKSELYNQVWMVGKNGKKLAGQVIPKENSECLRSKK